MKAMLKPILFNTEMVRAILDGRKTQTRRLIKPQPEARLCYAFAGSRGMPGTWGYPSKDAEKNWGPEWKLPDNLKEPDRRWTPPCHTDDILWVRETWAHVKFGNGEWHYEYRANCEDPTKFSNGSFAEWHPSIHMPKEAARLFLKVTNVRVERLQDISKEDVKSEGTNMDDWYDYDDYQHRTCDGLAGDGISVRFETLKGFFGHTVWDSTMNNLEQWEKYGWDANPWVWVIEFSAGRGWF